MKIIYFKIFAIIFIALSGKAFSSGCHATYLEGTRPGYGRVPLYSASLLGIDSLLLKSESNQQDKDKRTATNAGLVASGVYFYFALHGYCKSVDKKKYDELWSKRENLLAKGTKVEELPHELRWLLPIPADSQLQDEIQRWKRLQKYLLFIVGGLNSVLLFENGQAADTDGVRYFSYLSIGGILGMALFDVDNLWNDEPPFWANLNAQISMVDSKWSPGLLYTYEY